MSLLFHSLHMFQAGSSNLPSCVEDFIPFYSEKFSGVFPDGSNGKQSACNAGDLGLIPCGEDPLEEGMATHSSILAWRIPWTEESGWLQSMGLQRVGHD